MKQSAARIADALSPEFTLLTSIVVIALPQQLRGSLPDGIASRVRRIPVQLVFSARSNLTQDADIPGG